MELNHLGERTRELGEPPHEHPRMLLEALRLAADELPIEAVAEALGVSPAALQELLLHPDTGPR